MSDPNPFSDAEQRVRDAWQARCGVRRGPLEQADVDAIAEAAFALEGVKPTVEFIRRIAGGGSPNTIHPKLDAWFRQGRQVAAPSAVPAELLTLWERLQADATRVAQDDLAPMHASIADDRATLTMAQAQLAIDQAALANERATTERLVAAMREEFQGLQTRNDALLADVAQLQEDARRSREESSQRQHAIHRLERELADALRDGEVATASLMLTQADNAALTGDVAAARAQAGAAESQVTALQTAATDTTAALTTAERRTDALASELANARAEAAAQSSRGDRMEQALALVQATASSETALRDHLVGELGREREALVQARDAASRTTKALAAREATVTALTLEAGRLHALLHAATLAAGPAAEEPS